MRSPAVRLLKEALVLARKRIKQEGADLGMDRFALLTSMRRLFLAHNMTDEWNEERCVPTYNLFPYLPEKSLEVQELLRRRRLESLTDVVDRDIRVLERECRQLKISVPVELRFFHEAYQQLTKPRRQR